MLVVIIPSVFTENLDIMMASMWKNTVFPDKVIVIDNSDSGWRPQMHRIEINCIRPEAPLSVNESWNFGLSLTPRKAKIVGILNDDLLLNPWFFERVRRGFVQYLDAGCICPVTTENLESFALALDDDGFKSDWMNLTMRRMNRREGWAMMFRAEAIRTVPPIPTDNMKTFCGDDWYWRHVRQQGWRWYSDRRNLIFHAKGRTVKKLGLSKSSLKLEKREFERITSCG